MKRTTVSGGDNGRSQSRWDRRYATVLVSLAVLIPACSPNSSTPTAKSGVQSIVVTVAPVKLVTLRRTVSGVGTLYAHEDVLLAPKVDGRVLKVLKNEGDTAYPGEVLLELDPTDALLAIGQAEPALQAELKRLKLDAIPETDAAFTAHLPKVDSVAQARANLELAEKELARIDEEVKRAVGSVQVLDSARTKAKVARTAVELAETEARVTLAHARRLKAMLSEVEDRLRETQLRAPVPDDWPAWSAVLGSAANPIRYSVAARMVHKGATISPMRVNNAFRLVTDHILKLRVAVPERYSPDVHVGQAVDVHVEAYPGVNFPGTVARIFPTVDPENRTFVTEVEVPNCARKLKAGGFANAEVLVRTDTSVTMVPAEAVVTFAGVTKVYVVEGETAKAIEVELGAREKDSVEIRGAIAAGAKVITSGQSQLVDGSPIRVR